MRARIFAFFVCVLVFWGVGAVSAQQSRLGAAIEFYGQGLWGEAINELRRFQSETADNAARSEAQFWIGMCSLAAGRYRDAQHDFDEVIRLNSSSTRRLDATYQKGRAFFYLQNYNEAIICFKEYSDNIELSGVATQDAYNRKAAALFWTAECLYMLDEFSRAAKIYETITTLYNSSVKNEAAQNRLTMIKQKMTEEGLLEIIRLSNDGESGGNEYNDALLAYKNSIAPFIMQSGSVPAQGSVSTRSSPVSGSAEINNQDPDTLMRLLQIKTQALEMMERLTSTLNAFESLEWEKRERW